jgi:hypothetical protein
MSSEQWSLVHGHCHLRRELIYLTRQAEVWNTVKILIGPQIILALTYQVKSGK